MSRLREATLQDLAARGGGRYAHVDAMGDMLALRAAISAPPLPTQLPSADPRPVWTRYDLPFVLGMAALALVLLESLLDASLPRLPSLRSRRVA